MRLGISNREKSQCLKSWTASGLISEEVEEDEDDSHGFEQGSEDDRD